MIPGVSSPRFSSGQTLPKRTGGFTLVELVSAIAILVLIISFGALNVRPLDNALQGGAAVIAASIQEARSEAMATTSAVRVGLSAGTLTFTAAADCNPLTPNNGLAKTAPPLLPAKTTLTGDTSPLNLCLSSRGEASRVTVLTFRDRNAKALTITVFLAGGVSTQ